MATIALTSAQLFVRDVTASCAWYRDRLGFRIMFTYGTPPYYAGLRRGLGAINLRHTDAPIIDPTQRDRDELLSATMEVATTAEIRALHAEFQAAGVLFHRDLTHEPWDALTVIVKDPDGNLILFAGPAKPGAT